jgi:hypothetical protein
MKKKKGPDKSSGPLRFPAEETYVISCRRRRAGRRLRQPV